ncbi:MAG: isoprenylcysteine carboxylmethyltransferase family protein [Candidatus Acidiferrales bacterium]
MMKATDFEFRNRFWVIGAYFFVAFSLYNLDRLNVVQFLIDRTVGRGAPNGDAIARAAFAFAALLVFAAALIRTWAAAYLRSNVVQDPNLHTEAVVADGPYRHLRNPLYLGTILIACGIAFLASRIGAVVLVVGLTLFCLRLIGLEESKLGQQQGESYREFCRRVPRLWPSISPRLPASGLDPRWRQAFLGEIFVWGFFVALAAFAITLKIVLTWVIMALALLLYIVRSYILYGRNKRAAASK